MNTGSIDRGTEQWDIVSSWADPEFAKERGMDVPPDGWIGDRRSPERKGFRLTILRAFLIWLVVLGLGLLTGLVLGIVFAIAYLVLNPHAAPESLQSAVKDSELLAVIGLIIGEIEIIAVALIIRIRSSLKIRDNLSLSKLNMVMILSVPVICLSYFVVSSEMENISAMVFGRIEAFSLSTTQVSSIPGAGGLAIAIICIGVLPAVIEETLFRGVIQVGLTNKYGAMKAIIVTSILFSTLHISPTVLLPIFVMSLVIGYVFYKTNNLLYPIAFHLLNNVVAVLLTRYHSSFSIEGINSTSNSIEHVNGILLLVTTIVFAASIVALGKYKLSRNTTSATGSLTLEGSVG